MANELDPRTRKEVFLAGMLYGDPDDLPDPNTRDELYMKAIAETIKEGGVPSPEGADVGDVLTIGADGPEWAAPSGGDSHYLHEISYRASSESLMFSIITDSPEPYTYLHLAMKEVFDKYGADAEVPANGERGGSNFLGPISSLKVTSATDTGAAYKLYGLRIYLSDGALNSTSHSEWGGTVGASVPCTDLVTEI